MIVPRLTYLLVRLSLVFVISADNGDLDVDQLAQLLQRRPYHDRVNDVFRMQPPTRNSLPSALSGDWPLWV